MSREIEESLRKTELRGERERDNDKREIDRGSYKMRRVKKRDKSI